MRYFIIATLAVALASCTADTQERAMVMPVAPEFVAEMPTIATSDCELDFSQPILFTLMLTNINGQFVAAPLIATVTLDVSDPANPTAFATNPYATSATEWLNGYIDEDGYLHFDLPFTLSDGTVEYVNSVLDYNPDSGFLVVQTENTSDGNNYRFVGSLICE